MSDDLSLHDAAADHADEAIAGLHKLAVEGIPQRIARIRGELFSILEAAWLTNSVQMNALQYSDLTDEARLHALRMHQMTSQVDAALMLADRALEPLKADRCGDDFDLLLDTALNVLSNDWIRGYFIGAYQDQDRGETVKRLNALLRPSGEGAGQ